MFIKMNAGKFKDYYTLGQPLGQGAFAEVRKCQHKVTKTINAVKIIKKEKMNEIQEASFQ